MNWSNTSRNPAQTRRPDSPTVLLAVALAVFGQFIAMTIAFNVFGT
jgi:hypothetical protein